MATAGIERCLRAPPQHITIASRRCQVASERVVAYRRCRWNPGGGAFGAGRAAGFAAASAFGARQAAGCADIDIDLVGSAPEPPTVTPAA